MFYCIQSGKQCAHSTVQSDAQKSYLTTYLKKWGHYNYRPLSNSAQTVVCSSETLEMSAIMFN